MRNSALVPGLIGGLWAMIVGFFSYGYTEVIERWGNGLDMLTQVEDVTLIRTASFLAPLLAIAGAAMARSRNMAAGLLMLAACLAVLVAFGFNVFTMFPIAFCGLGGVLALLARQPDAY